MERMACDLKELKFADSGDAMTFSGYGAVFGNVDAGGDVIAHGAFTKSLGTYGSQGRLPPMFYEHGKMGGGPILPVGVWKSMTQDGTGLKVEGQLLDHEYGRALHTAMKAGAVDGLSIGYKVTDAAYRTRPTEPRRTIKSAHLAEVSLVNDPMNALAVVTNVKSAEEWREEIKTIREFEDFLRDAGGYSAAEAKRLASRGFKALDADRDDGAGLSTLAEALRRNASILKA